MSLLDIAKQNADQTRLDRMKRVNATAKNPTIQNGTYLGKAEDGTDIVQVDGQTGETSGHRLISNKSMAEGDRVQVRPSENGLQRVDAKNQERVAPQAEVPDILEFYTSPNFINHINMTEIDEYTITLEKLGANPLTITRQTDYPSSVSFELNSVAISITTNTPISFSGDTATLRVIFSGSDPRRLVLLFYNGKVDKKGANITKSITLFNFFYQTFTVVFFTINCVRGKDLAKTSLTYKSEIVAKSVMLSSYKINVNSGAYLLTGSQKKTLKLTGYPLALDSYLSTPGLPVGNDTAILKLETNNKSKGHVLKNLASTTIKTLSAIGRLNYEIYVNSNTLANFGDFLYPNLDNAGTETVYTSSTTASDGHYQMSFATSYYNLDLVSALPTPDVLPDDKLITLSGGSLPAPLTAGDYYFTRITESSFGLSATEGGDFIEITGSGYGTIDFILDFFDPEAVGFSAFNGLNFTTEPYTGGTFQLTIEIKAGYWQEFISRYSSTSLGGLNEELEFEFTANEYTETLYTTVDNGGINLTFTATELADADALNMAIRFKRKLGSTWFQV
jgi:hypothetical protein